MSRGLTSAAGPGTHIQHLCDKHNEILAAVGGESIVPTIGSNNEQPAGAKPAVVGRLESELALYLNGARRRIDLDSTYDLTRALHFYAEQHPESRLTT
jgi:hypothetical protein